MYGAVRKFCRYFVEKKRKSIVIDCLSAGCLDDDDDDE